uniref:Uncharacterized protein n=1 Tax=Rhizophora mucronata TaxID=61149 RepID=A0A2P2PGY4_RHIMU
MLEMASASRICKSFMSYS